MTNVAVVGSGYWGKNLVRNFDELGVLHTICDNNPATLKSFQEKYPDKHFQTSFETVLESPAIDAVVIATPAETHFELAKSALSSGKHTFVEKPLALVGGEAEELQRIAQGRNLKLMVGHILLYHPAIIKLKEIVDSGELGKINYIYSNRLNLGKFRIEENILWSFAPHDISVILHLLGRDAHTGHGPGRQLFKRGYCRRDHERPFFQKRSKGTYICKLAASRQRAEACGRGRQKNGGL